MDIYLYGNIDNWTSEFFGFELDYADSEINLHINSSGGDLFAGLAIGNLIKKSNKKVTAQIDGLCASAATLISCACEKVVMAENALMMLHLPFVDLENVTLNEESISKMQKRFESVKNSILQTYREKTNLSDEELGKLLSEETWLNASDAQRLGFADEISAAVEMEFNDESQEVTVQNHAFKPKNYLQFKSKFSAKSEKTFLEKLKEFLSKDDKPPADETRLKEVARIKTLNAARGKNPYVNAILDVAISEGKTLNSVQKYLSAVESVKQENKVENEILKLIEDQLTSGAEKIQGAGQIVDREEKVKLLKKFA